MPKKVESPQQRFKRIEKQGKAFDKKMKEKADLTEKEARKAMKEHYAGLVAPAKASGWKAGTKIIKPTGDNLPRG